MYFNLYNDNCSIIKMKIIKVWEHYMIENNEIRWLKKTAQHVINLDKSITWMPSFPGCVYEFKTTELMSQTEAGKLLLKMKSLEKEANWNAYSIQESRVAPGSWRIVVTLDNIQELL